MKTAFILLLISIGIASAQTNTNSAPIIINFTNTLGEFITNATVVSVSANKLIYRTQDGVGGGVIRLDKLPPELQAKFNYDPDEANKANQMDNDKKVADRKSQALLAQQMASAARLEECREKMKAQAIVICGRVIQRLDNGLLLSAANIEDNIDGYTEDSLFKAMQKSYDSGNFTGKVHWASGIVFLADYPSKNQMAGGDKFITLAYPYGFYKYTTVNNSESTIRRYTSDFEQAVSYDSGPYRGK